MIGTFCGMGKFPYSIIGTSQDLFVEFVSSPAGKYYFALWRLSGKPLLSCQWILVLRFPILRYLFFCVFPGPLLNTGFHFNVGNWPGRVDTAGTRNGTCDWLLSSETLRALGDSEGIFLSVAHWYPPHTSCTYLMQGEPGEIVRLYFPRWVQHEFFYKVGAAPHSQ